MTYGLRKSLSLCEIDGHIILLDIDQDRYFRLTEDLEQALLTYTHGKPISNIMVSALCTINVLTRQSYQDPNVRPQIQLPLRSAIEYKNGVTRHLSLKILLEALWLVCLTRLRLRTTPLKDVVSQAIHERRSKSYPHLETKAPLDVLTAEAAGQFMQVRRYIPIEPNCLLDSLSLLSFLSRRNLPSKIVIGVTLNPFSAHCWVQAGTMVLNETVSVCRAHTPIKVI